MGAAPDAQSATAKFRPPAGFWASPFPAGTLWVAAALLVAAAGCAHTNAPCPVPTPRVDEHRAAVERLDAEVGNAREQERAEKARRDEAARRTAAARAALDSLAATGGPEASQR